MGKKSFSTDDSWARAWGLFPLHPCHPHQASLSDASLHRPPFPPDTQPAQSRPPEAGCGGLGTQFGPGSCLSQGGNHSTTDNHGWTHRFLLRTVVESGKSKRKVLANSVSGKSWLPGSQNAALSLRPSVASPWYVSVCVHIYMCLGKGAVGERKQAFSLRGLLLWGTNL